MSTGRVIMDAAGIKAKAPDIVYISDGTKKYPVGHPLYLTEVEPVGLLLLDLYNNEYNEFRVDSDRDFNLELYNHMNGSRYKLFVYRKTSDSVNLTFSKEGFTYVVPGIAEGETEKLLILDIEVVLINGVLVNKIGPTSEKIDEVIAALNTNSIKLSEDIIVNGTEQGSFKDGDTIPKEISLTNIIKSFVQVANPVIYYSPTFGITPNNTTVEAGTMVNPTIVPSFNQKDAGGINRYLLQLSTNGAANVSLLDVLALQNFVQDSIQVQDGAYLKYTATAYYDEGLTKLNNMGVEVPDGKILAGDLSDTLTYSGGRQAFYGTDLGSVNPSTSDEIRALAGKRMNPANGTAFTLNIPAGAKRILIAYPDTLRDLTSVNYAELNAEVVDTFTKVNLQVNGVNGFTAIGYKIFVYIPAIAFGSSATYNVTI